MTFEILSKVLLVKQTGMRTFVAILNNCHAEIAKLEEPQRSSVWIDFDRLLAAWALEMNKPDDMRSAFVAIRAYINSRDFGPTPENLPPYVSLVQLVSYYLNKHINNLSAHDLALSIHLLSLAPTYMPVRDSDKKMPLKMALQYSIEKATK